MDYSVYIVDDEESVRYAVHQRLRKLYEVAAFPNAEEAIDAVRKKSPDLILLDIGLPGLNGIDALRIIKEIDKNIIVIMVTAFEDVDTVISAMKLGAHDYVVKPIQIDPLKKTIENALETIKLRKEIQRLQDRYLSENLPCFIGESNSIQDVIQFVTKVAKSPDTPVLVTGESGTGKELIASAIHYKSPNFKGPFVTINCAAIPKDLLESELFGYEKGAFSGAASSGKKGLIEEADCGTLFLDEVGDLSAEGQAKMLRFLEEGEFYRVGGTKKQKVQARIVSATNRNLKKMIDDGHFRLDLFYRLAVVKVEIPSLNERVDDIIPIAKHFLIQCGTKLGKSFTGMSSQAEEFLKGHKWEGNIRELKNMIERGALLSDGPELKVQDFGAGNVVLINTGNNQGETDLNGFPLLTDAGVDLDALESYYIKEACRLAKGNDRKAAEYLKMSYYTFRYRKKKLDETE